MRFGATEEEVMIRDTASRILSDTWDRSRRNSETVAGITAGDTARQLTELGLMAAWLPEVAGGSDGGPRMLMEIAGQLGRHQFPSTYLGSATLSAHLLSLAEGDLAAQWLARIASGEAVVATGFYEPGRRYALAPEATAEERVDGVELNGQKAHVLDGPLADAFLVTAQFGGKTGICIVPRDSDGVSIAPYDAVDGTPLCRLDLDRVELGADAVILGGIRAAAALDDAITMVRFAAASEILGMCDAALAETLDYLRLREQFGRTLNRFQALQHRAADLHVEVEMLRSLILGAANMLADGGPARARQDVLAATAYAFTTGDLVGREAIHLHGAIGMTRDLGVGRFLMRSNTLSKVFGDLGQVEAEMADTLGLTS